MQKTVAVSATSVLNLQAIEIKEIGSNFVTIVRKKPSTSKVLEETIFSDVLEGRKLIAVYGNEGEAGQVQVQDIVAVTHQTGEVVDNGQSITVTPEEDSPVTFFKSAGVSVTALSEAYALEAEAEEE